MKALKEFFSFFLCSLFYATLLLVYGISLLKLKALGQKPGFYDMAIKIPQIMMLNNSIINDFSYVLLHSIGQSRQLQLDMVMFNSVMLKGSEITINNFV
jgi:hypothetical protein